MPKIAKQAVLYLRKDGTDYQCRDCSMFLAGPERCSIHGPKDRIRAVGSCGYFVKGKPMPNMKPMGEVTVLESGYVESLRGFSCKRCGNYQPAAYRCRVVNEASKGDDAGEIHPDACCNAWIAMPAHPETDRADYWRTHL